jgi:hypothetical protein
MPDEMHLPNFCTLPPTPAGVLALSVTAPNGQSSVLIGSAHVGVEGLLEPIASLSDHVATQTGVPTQAAHVLTGLVAAVLFGALYRLNF